MEFVGALSTLNMNLNFLIAILVVLAVILTAVIVMAMYRSGIPLIMSFELNAIFVIDKWNVE